LAPFSTSFTSRFSSHHAQAQGSEKLEPWVAGCVLHKTGRLRSGHGLSKTNPDKEIRTSQGENWSRTKTPVWAGATRHFGRKCRPNVMQRVAPAQTPRVVCLAVSPRPIFGSKHRVQPGIAAWPVPSPEFLRKSVNEFFLKHFADFLAISSNRGTL